MNEKEYIKQLESRIDNLEKSIESSVFLLEAVCDAIGLEFDKFNVTMMFIFRKVGDEFKNCSSPTERKIIKRIHKMFFKNVLSHVEYKDIEERLIKHLENYCEENQERSQFVRECVNKLKGLTKE
jgi:hypothetical protein